MGLLTQAAEWLYALNPSLCKTPPRGAPDEYCYMGPDGGEEGAIFCKDILKSHASCVGSWMLSPERHIVEGIFVTIVAFYTLVRVTPMLHKIMDHEKIQIQHPPGARFASLFCFSAILCYKYFGYPARVFYFVMPCNMQWVLSFMQCLLIPEAWTFFQYTVLQLRISYIMSVIIAIVTPETADCELPGEYIFYWVNHFILLFLPAAYIANGSVSCLPPPQEADKPVSTYTFNLLWWAYSCAVFAIFYFGPVVVMAVYSGLNLNFMMHPPHDHCVLTGQWYRFKSCALLALLFGVSRLIALEYEKAGLGHNRKDAAKSKES